MLNYDIEEGFKRTLLNQLGDIAMRIQSNLQTVKRNGHIIVNVEANKYWKRNYEPG